MKKTEKIFNVQTFEETIIEKDETPAEKKLREKFEKDLIKAQAEAEANAVAKSTLLAKLGITEDEAKLLLS